MTVQNNKSALVLGTRLLSCTHTSLHSKNISARFSPSLQSTLTIFNTLLVFLGVLWVLISGGAGGRCSPGAAVVLWVGDADAFLGYLKTGTRQN